MTATETGSARRHMAGALGIYTAGGLFWAFLPFFVGLQVSSGGLSQVQAGSLGSAYLVGFSAASLTALWWAPTFNWRLLTGVATVSIIAALLLLADADAYFTGLVSVAVVGVMMGSLWSIAYRIFSVSDKPERSFAIGIVVSYTALAAVSYVIGQFVVPGYGLTGSAYLLSAVILVLGLSGLLIPSGPDKPDSASSAVADSRPDSHPYRPPLAVAMALLGILATGFAFAAVWTFAERIGVAAGFGSARISPVIASNLLASAAGSVAATVIGTRFGNRMPLFAGMALLLVSILLLTWAGTFWSYALAVAGLGFSVGFVLPYQMGRLAALDVEGRFAVLIAAAQGIGSACGPILGGVAFDAGGVRALLILASLGVLVSTAAFLSILNKGETS